MKDSFNHKSSFPEFPRDEVRTAITKGIQQAEEQNNMNQTPRHVTRRSRRTPLLYVASAAAAFGIMIGSAYISPTFASTLAQLPIVGSVFGDSGLLGLKQASEQGLTKTVGEKQIINGIAVTVDEVLYDDTNITVGIKIESEKELSNEYFGAGMDLKMNGKFLSGSGSYGEENLSPTIRTGITTFNVTDDMPNSFELGLILEGKEGEKWEFSTPIKKIVDIVQLPVNHQQQAQGIQLDVSKVSVSPSGIGLAFEATEAGNSDNPQLAASFIEFRITDEQGKELTSHSGGLKGQFNDGVWVFSGNKTFDPISDNVSTLIITPYLMLPTGGSGVQIQPNGEETKLPFDKSTLKEVKFQPFTVEVPSQNNH
ncbi:DUF4179 domain-containing protein [Lysinibacillus parviboronicapiens]|uniref:DUF4179 domain-containing protein n=1 Tax=Lysinibacillus parviboronicapiens TaxID=436516 RepID=UPI0006D13A6E|nr:DUF4179 domain-containing protein [Lysinibacillus parviboronicapiens]